MQVTSDGHGVASRLWAAQKTVPLFSTARYMDLSQNSKLGEQNHLNQEISPDMSVGISGQRGHSDEGDVGNSTQSLGRRQMLSVEVDTIMPAPAPLAGGRPGEVTPLEDTLAANVRTSSLQQCHQR